MEESIDKIIGEITTEGLPISYVKLIEKFKEIALRHTHTTGSFPLFNVNDINQIIHETAEELR